MTQLALTLLGVVAVVAAWDSFRRYLAVRGVRTVEQVLSDYIVRTDAIQKTFLESLLDLVKLGEAEHKRVREKYAANAYEQRRRT